LDHPLKIAIFSQSLVAGGAERVVANFTQGFARHKISVHLLLAKSHGSMLDEIPENVRLVDFDQEHVVQSLPHLVKYLRTERPAILFSFLTHANLVALLAGLLAHTSVKIIVSEHSLLSKRTKLYPNLKERLLPWLARLFYNRADAIIAVSNGVEEDLISNVGIPAGKIHVINNPIVTPDLLIKKLSDLVHPWFSPGSPPVLLAVGRLTAEKDYPTLLRAFALARRDRDMRLLILGEGKERTAMELLIQELGLAGEVLIPGFVDNPYAYMARAALFILTSISEGLPSVLIEALACGTPVVSTNCESGPAEILDYGRYGRLVPTGNSMEISRAILETLDSVPDSALLQKRANEFGLETVINEYLSIFKSLLPFRWSEEN
jgi:glycosyltransferase involved in cell wall biosynthesis